MPTEQKNQTGSDAEQMLRDLLKSAGMAGKHKLVEQVASILASPEFSKSIATNADRIYNTRAYKDVRFVQAVALQESSAPGILNTLNPAELQLFTLLERIATRGTFQIAHAQAQAMLGIKSKTTVRNAFNGLLNKHILYVVEPATTKTAPIYRINSHICRAGKDKPQEQDLKDLQSIQDWDVLEQRMRSDGLVLTEATRVEKDGSRKRKYTTVDTVQ